MGSGAETDYYYYESSPTPIKLSLFSLPTKQHEPPGLSPIHTLASVPFQWEEAPGKPRSCCTTKSNPKSTTTTTTTARCLELPPRLFDVSKVNNMSSPTTVLDGPYYYVGTRPLSRSLSFGKGRSYFENLQGLMKSNIIKERVIFGSGRWGSFRKNKDHVLDPASDDHLDFNYGGGGTKVKITRVKRRSSFLNFPSTTSHLWTSVCESFKQVVPWRRKQEEKLRRQAS